MHRKIAILDTFVPSKRGMLEDLQKYYSHINVESISFLSAKKNPLAKENTHGSVVLFELTRSLWDVEVICLEVLGQNGVGTPADIYAALHWCTKNDFDWVHTSTGYDAGSFFFQRKMQSVSKKLRKQGKVLTASAGNLFGKAVMYPAAFPEWLAIGADAAYASQGEEVMFSLTEKKTQSQGLYGPVEWDGTSRTAPDIAGLGYRILLEFEKLPFEIEDKQEAVAIVLCFLAKQPSRPKKWEILHHTSKRGFGTLDWLKELMWNQYDKWSEDNETVST